MVDMRLKCRLAFCKKIENLPEFTIHFFLQYRNIAVLGAGLMGAGVAQISIAKGMNVILKDVNEQGITNGTQAVEKGLKELVKRKKRTQFEVDSMMSKLSPQIDYTNFKNVDMVIEAVFEDINLKSKIVKETEQVSYYCCN